jgi:hypothetical protein
MYIQACLSNMTIEIGNSFIGKLHIKLLKQFESPITFTSFIEPLLPENRTGQSWELWYDIQLNGESAQAWLKFISFRTSCNRYIAHAY